MDDQDIAFGVPFRAAVLLFCPDDLREKFRPAHLQNEGLRFVQEMQATTLLNACAYGDFLLFAREGSPASPFRPIPGTALERATIANFWSGLLDIEGHKFYAAHVQKLGGTPALVLAKGRLWARDYLHVFWRDLRADVFDGPFPDEAPGQFQMLVGAFIPGVSVPGYSHITDRQMAEYQRQALLAQLAKVRAAISRGWLVANRPLPSEAAPLTDWWDITVAPPAHARTLLSPAPGAHAVAAPAVGVEAPTGNPTQRNADYCEAVIFVREQAEARPRQEGHTVNELRRRVSTMWRGMEPKAVEDAVNEGIEGVAGWKNARGRPRKGNARPGK